MWVWDYYTRKITRIEPRSYLGHSLSFHVLVVFEEQCITTLHIRVIKCIKLLTGHLLYYFLIYRWCLWTLKIPVSMKRLAEQWECGSPCISHDRLSSFNGWTRLDANWSIFLWLTSCVSDGEADPYGGNFTRKEHRKNVAVEWFMHVEQH